MSVITRGEGRGTYGVLVGKLGRKRQLGKPKNRRDDNIKTVIQEVGFEGMD